MINKYMIQEATKMLLDGLGVDRTNPNFKETPARVARSYEETCNGLENLQDKVSQILSTKFPSEGYEGMIVETGITIYSLCPHHLLPVSYYIDIGYIPSKDKTVLGASKLSRVAEVLGKRPVLQETLTNDIIKCFDDVSPLGVAVIISGRHQCMRCRGIKQKDSMLHTSLMTGAFKDNDATRQEMFHIMQRGRALQ